MKQKHCMYRGETIAAEKTPGESSQYALEAEQTQWGGRIWDWGFLHINYPLFRPIWTHLAAQLCGGGSIGDFYPAGSVVDAMSRLDFRTGRRFRTREGGFPF